MSLILARHKSDSGFINVASEDGQSWISLSDTYESMPILSLLDNVDKETIKEIIKNKGGVEISSEFLNCAPTVAGDHCDIWGAGLNYRVHANDLEVEQPTSGPGSYFRPNGCLISNGDDIVLPTQSHRVTAEAELGLVIGKKCKNVAKEDWRSVVSAVTTVLDITAEDVIRENPRYIPWAKGFDTFCSIGPTLVPLDRFTDDTIGQLRVSTIRNGQTIATALVSDMRYDLGYLVSHFSAGRTLHAGTIICTGTPGAAVIKDGDTVEAVVESVGHLSHEVIKAENSATKGNHRTC